MEKARWQWSRPDKKGLFGIERSVFLSCFVAVVLYWLSGYGDVQQQQQKISAEDLAYGLAQCALHDQRPVVDYGLAATRLNRPRTGPQTILRNATLINGDGSVSTACTISMQEGIFRSVQCREDIADSTVDSTDIVLNLHGRAVTPGLVDMHSHAGVRQTPQLWATEDVTEISAPVTPWARAIDALKPQDQAIGVIGSGGVTTSLVLTGAKNLISGEGVVIKMRQHADTVLDLLPVHIKGTEHQKPQRYLKMAMGENQKRQFEHVAGGPSTRLGESFWFRKAYDNARRVKQAQDSWCAAASSGGSGGIFSEYPRSLEWQTLVDVLRGDLRVNVHGYETEDTLALLDHAEEFGFPVTAFHHALHSDLVAAELRRRDIAVVAFSDSWGDKLELYNVSNFLAKRVAVDYGLPLALTRDHPAEHGQWLIYEAQIAHHYGLPADLAIASVAAQPARLLGLDNRLGFVRPGYDADLVVWDRHPLRVGATPLEVFVDGHSEVRASEHLWAATEPNETLTPPSSRPEESPTDTGCVEGPADVVIHGLRRSFVGSDGLRTASEIEGSNLTAVLRKGRVVCVGETTENVCSQQVTRAQADGIPTIHVRNGHMITGLTIVSRQHGLVEMRQESSTTDGASNGNANNALDRPLESRFGIKFDGIHIGRAYRSGITRIVTPPLTTGFLHGISTRFRPGASSVLDDGAISDPQVALHFTIGHDGKNDQTPSITSQISTLHDLLTQKPPLHPVYARAARGDLPVVIHTNNKDVIAHMIALKRDTGAHIVIMGGTEAHLLAAPLAAAHIPVLVAPFWGCEPLFWEGRRCLPGPPLVDALGPRVLLDAGVTVGIANWDDTNNHIGNSLWEAGWIGGANRSTALDLVSHNIEKMLRLPPAGDIVVYEGDPFEFGARVAVSFEEGIIQSCYPRADE